jgi:hypothetical protein
MNHTPRSSSRLASSISTSRRSRNLAECFSMSGTAGPPSSGARHETPAPAPR